MCFSPGADVVVGGIVVVIGADALRHVQEPKQILLASLPLLFGLHQLDEAFVWLRFVVWHTKRLTAAC